MKHAPKAVAALVAGLLALAACDSGSTAKHAVKPKPRGTRPNILFVLTDDLDVAELDVMPNVKALLGAQGTSFDRYYASVSLCCPSRTTTLRGQYSHNTGVETNGGGNGGFEVAHTLGIERSTIATWLHAAGYRTALFGKYLNGYPNTVPATSVPPGWDEWASPADGNPYTEYDYTLNENGTLTAHGHAPADYGTDVYVGKTADFVTRAGKNHKPFFAYVAVYAPHLPATPAPGDGSKFPDAKAPRTESYNQADVTGMPPWIQARPLMTPEVQDRIDGLYRRRIESLQAVDRGVGRLVDTLRANGQLDDTFIVFTSDNGFHLGQHRMPAGKQTAYEEDVHLPLLVRGPGVRASATDTHLVGNIDLAPTFAELAGVGAPAFVDGRSFAALLRGSPPPARWRSAYLVEHWNETTAGRVVRGNAPVEPADPEPSPDTTPTPGSRRNRIRRSRAGLAGVLPEFHGIRTDRYTYVEYVTGDRELYDNRADPAQVHNLVATADPALLARLSRRVRDLTDCQAADCRTAEDRLSDG